MVTTTQFGFINSIISFAVTAYVRPYVKYFFYLWFYLWSIQMTIKKNSSKCQQFKNKLSKRGKKKWKRHFQLPSIDIVMSVTQESAAYMASGLGKASL